MTGSIYLEALTESTCHYFCSLVTGGQVRPAMFTMWQTLQHTRGPAESFAIQETQRSRGQGGSEGV